jgi:hypothetical protein
MAGLPGADFAGTGLVSWARTIGADRAIAVTMAHKIERFISVSPVMLNPVAFPITLD